MLDCFSKRPADHLDYEFDFSRWMADGDRINTATATVSSGAGFAVTSVVWDEMKARAWIQGGALGEDGQIVVTIVTVQGRQKQVAARMRILED